MPIQNPGPIGPSEMIRFASDMREHINMARIMAEMMWDHYASLYPECDERAARASGATHLPDDIRMFLDIDRYGSATK